MNSLRKNKTTKNEQRKNEIGLEPKFFKGKLWFN